MIRIASVLCAFALFAEPALASAQSASPVPSSSAAPTPDPLKVQQLALDVLTQLQNRSLDRSLFSDQLNAQLTVDVIRNLGGQLSAIGTPSIVLLSSTQLDDGITGYQFLLRVSGAGNLDEIIAIGPDGKIVGLNFVPDHTHV
jgi:hypothetical protein